MRPRSLSRLVWPSAVLVLVVWSARGAGVDPARLFGADGRTQIARFLAGLFPPEMSSAYLLGLVGPAIETVQMSLLGVVFGAAIAMPLAAFGMRAPGAAAPGGRGRAGTRVRLFSYHVARSILNTMRTIPDLVWALMFIAAVGLGPFSGVLALTVHSAGLLGKLYSEALESVDPVPVHSLQAAGAGAPAVLVWGVLPQAIGPLVSVTLYQWECNIRAAMVLGFVGAGGLGQRIDLAMRLFRYDEMLPLLAVLLLLVTMVDRLSATVRSGLIKNL
ncbi:MAG: phosphonate ABC transporter, permease protein PhnE [Actinobacteria bacterium]|nr:phosphonate ABC transporter, permease protein PhnE [Actinomycetota bacterium]MCL5887681.1 phosphonate ABC transporter, permease protein PhnE [Actinomycetota bacterium]